MDKNKSLNNEKIKSEKLQHLLDNFEKTKKDFKNLLKKHGIDTNDKEVKKMLDERFFNIFKTLLTWILLKK